MANPLVRDPKGNPNFPNLVHNLPKQESASFRANLAVAQHGLSPDEQALVAQEATVGKDVPSVQNYIVDMSVGLHEWSGNAVELAKFIPAIRDMNALAQEDAILTKKEKARVDGYAKFLIQFIQKKISLKARIKGTFKKVAKATRTSVGESLSDTSSIIGKIAGAMLKPREKKETADLDVKKARAGAFEKMAEMEAGRKELEARHAKYAAMGWNDDDFPYADDWNDEEGGGRRRGHGKGFDYTSLLGEEEEVPKKSTRRPRRVATPEPEPVPTKPAHVKKKKFSVIPEEEPAEKTKTAAVTTSLKGTNTRLDKVVAEVTKTNVLLKSGLDADKQREDASERAADEGKAATTITAPSLSPVKEKKGKGGSLFGGLGDLLKGFDLGKLIGPMLLPAVSMLGQGILIAGAAFAGWELGKWLDELSGGRLSGGVAKMADWMLNTGDRSNKEQVTGAENDELQLARKRTHTLVPDLAAARKVNEDWVRHPETRKFDDMGKPLGATTPTPSAPPAAPAAPPAAPEAPATPQSTSPVKVPVGQMHVSEEGIAKLKTREGVRRDPYWDVTGWAIGYGDHEYQGKPLGNDRSQKPNVRLTETEAEDALRRRLQTHYEPIVRKNLGSKSVPQNEFDALVSVAYNSEAAAARLSRRAASGETLKKEDFLASGTVHGKRVPELQARRAAEYAQFVSGGRAAAPMAALTARASSGGNTTVVNAPVTQIAQGGGGSAGGANIVLQPMTVSNPDPMVRALRSVNAT